MWDRKADRAEKYLKKKKKEKPLPPKKDRRKEKPTCN
jgi:hypothetical protein